MKCRNKINQYYNLLLKKEAFNFTVLDWKSHQLTKSFQIFFKKKIKLEKYNCYEINKNIKYNLDIDSNKTKLVCRGFNKKTIFLSKLKKIFKLDSLNKNKAINI